MSAKPPKGFQKDHSRNYMSAEKILTRWKKKKIEETYLVMAENPYNLKCFFFFFSQFPHWDIPLKIPVETSGEGRTQEPWFSRLIFGQSTIFNVKR